MQFETVTYRAGAMERLRDAEVLHRRGSYSGSIYLAGRGVEAMLRSLVLLKDRRLEEGHQLRELATRIEDLGLLESNGHDAQFVANVAGVAKHWFNNMRFASGERIESWLRSMSAIRETGPWPRTLEEHSRTYFNRCSKVMLRCNDLWLRYRSRNSSNS